MTTWISSPSVFVPEAAESGPRVITDPVYARIFRAFSHSTERCEQSLLIPRACTKDREELAASAIEPLLEERDKSSMPEILVDCCSSAMIGGPAPTYKLASRCGLTKTLPFALDGLVGSEVAYAILFLQLVMVNKDGESIVSSVQRVVSPDSRIREHRFPLGDAAAAVICSCDRMETGFRVDGVACGRVQSSWRQAVVGILQDLLRKADVAKGLIKWSVGHRYSESFSSAAQEALYPIEWLVRDKYPEVNFGCCDVFVSLGQLNSSSKAAPAGTGILWFVGDFGSVAAVLVTDNDE